MTPEREPPRGADLFGHPRGLAVLAGAELWVAASIYGMQALLVLYMVDSLLLPGHVEGVAGFAAFRGALEGVTGALSTKALAAQIFGVFLGLTYLAPLLGGYVGDRWLGRQRTIVLGALLTTGGSFGLALDRSFLVALGLVVLGRGCMATNLLSQVGAAYGPTDRRCADGFQLYYTMVNLGAFIAPLATGAVAVAYGWHQAFSVGGFATLAALLVYVTGRRHLPADPPRPAKVARLALAPDERRRVKVLIAIVPLSTLVWVAQTQVWNVYNLWVHDHVDLSVLGWTMPVPWFQGADALAPLVMVPPLIAAWRWQARRKREPDDLGKMAIGAFLFCAGMVWLAAAPLVAGPSAKVPLLWALGFHVLSNAGWLYFVPLAAALYSKASPASMAGVMIALNTLSVSIASALSGRLGGLYETLSPSRFWLVHAALVGAGGVAYVVLGPWLRRALRSG
ncbi:MAG TPA: peptide MFS transporter [Labilithrix sp.]|nr:peptide MFS transporter [Labilithrix sp.]